MTDLYQRWKKKSDEFLMRFMDEDGYVGDVARRILRERERELEELEERGEIEEKTLDQFIDFTEREVEERAKDLTDVILERGREIGELAQEIGRGGVIESIQSIVQRTIEVVTNVAKGFISGLRRLFGR
jgi:butyrate kinase